MQWFGPHSVFLFRAISHDSHCLTLFDTKSLFSGFVLFHNILHCVPTFRIISLYSVLRTFFLGFRTISHYSAFFSPVSLYFQWFRAISNILTVSHYCTLLRRTLHLELFHRASCCFTLLIVFWHEIASFVVCSTVSYFLHCFNTFRSISHCFTLFRTIAQYFALPHANFAWYHTVSKYCAIRLPI